MRRARRAHPRSRGENALEKNGAYTGNGSSPLTRGKQNDPAARAIPSRLIPAHAGKTCWPPSIARARAAHPRSRGEND